MMTDSLPEHCATCGEPMTGTRLEKGHCPRCLFTITFGGDETPPEDEATAPWMRISGCELFEELGRGGMGVVYRAKQQTLNRVVAVKVLLRAQFAGAEERERFHREAQATARLKHPGIVGIFDVGEEDRVPWFSMEYIAGKSLEQMVREHPMDAKEAARCVKLVAEALQHAHDHGVLHRDLKPSNILVDEANQPRITDFGIARIGTSGTGGASLTRTGQMLGSPGYAAPEQALHGEANVSTDVYGLGALLYHLLTGRPPFHGPTLDAILVQLRENDPLSPRKLNPSVPRDLETICLKCLSKAPDSRYPTATAVADDLNRFLEGKPIMARPLGLFGKSWRWAYRHPAIAAMLAIIALLISGMIGGSLAFARHQAQLEQRTSLISEARSLRQRRIAGSRTDALAALRAAWSIVPSDEIRNEVISCLALPELGKRNHIATIKTPDPTRSGDGKRVAIIEGTTLIVRTLESGEEVARLDHQTPGSLIKLDDHGQRVAIAPPKSHDLFLVNLADGKTLATCAHQDTLGSVDWSGELIATGCDDYFVYIWDTKGTRHHRLSGHEAYPIRVSFRPRSQELMSISRDVHIRLWHVTRGEELVRHDLPHRPYHSVWWNEAGTQFSGATDDGGADIYPVAPSPILQVLAPPDEEPHTENLGSAALSADGTIAAVADEASVRVWDLMNARLAVELTGNPRSWRSAHFSPDQLWTCGWDEPLSSRALTRDAQGQLTVGPATVRMPDHGCILRSVSADGQMLVLSNNSTGKFIAFWPQTGRKLQVSEPGNLATQMGQDLTWLLTSSYHKNGAHIWSLPDGKLLRTLCSDDAVVQVILSPDGKRLLVNSGKHGYAFRTTDWIAEKIPSGDLQLESMAYSPDGHYIATLGDDHIRLRDPTTFADVMRLSLPPHIGWLGQGHLVFNADGSSLIIHTALGSVCRWDLAKLKEELQRLGMADQ